MKKVLKSLFQSHLGHSNGKEDLILWLPKLLRTFYWKKYGFYIYSGLTSDKINGKEHLFCCNLGQNKWKKSLNFHFYGSLRTRINGKILTILCNFSLHRNIFYFYAYSFPFILVLIDSDSSYIFATSFPLFLSFFVFYQNLVFLYSCPYSYLVKNSFPLYLSEIFLIWLKFSLKTQTHITWFHIHKWKTTYPITPTHTRVEPRSLYSGW